MRDEIQKVAALLANARRILFITGAGVSAESGIPTFLYQEMLPEDALRQFDKERLAGFDVVFSVGTTSVFSYVVGPILMAAHERIPTVEINPEETPLSRVVCFRFAAPAGPTLGRICGTAD